MDYGSCIMSKIRYAATNMLQEIYPETPLKAWSTLVVALAPLPHGVVYFGTTKGGTKCKANTSRSTHSLFEIITEHISERQKISSIQKQMSPHSKILWEECNA